MTGLRLLSGNERVLGQAKTDWRPIMRKRMIYYVERGFSLRPLATVIGKRCSCFKQGECKQPGKHPLTKASDLITNHRQVLEAFERFGWPLNVGIQTGEASGCVVLDVDGDAGAATLELLEKQHGRLPEGPRVITGSGGLHIFFAYDPERPIANRVRFRDGLDTRTDGGYVVAAPSKHKSGKRYKWVRGTRDLDFPEMPDWLYTLIASGAKIAINFDDYIAQTPPAIEGEGGSNVAFKVACTAVRSGIRHFDHFMHAIADWNAKCVPPWSEPELRHKFDDAIRQVESQIVPLPIDTKGNFIYNLENLGRIIEEDPKYAGLVQYNETRATIDYRGHVLRDSDVTAIRREIMRRYVGLKVNDQDLRDVLLQVAESNPINTLRDWLSALAWDGKERLRFVPTEILRTSKKITPARKALNSEMFRAWMIGAVSRAIEPGCKFDNILILTGPQGVMKSTFFRVLAGDDHFSDDAIDLNNKDSQLALQSTWVHEWSELEDILGSFRVARIKAFLGQRVDRFRKPYGRNVEAHPRRCVFAGSTNDPNFIADPSGARRFWIIETPRRIDIARLREWREQLWAEAYALYNSGALPFLSRDMERIRESTESEYRVDDPAMEIAEYARMLIDVEDDRLGEGITISELASEAGVPGLQKRDVMTATKMLRHIGLERARRGSVRVWRVPEGNKK